MQTVNRMTRRLLVVLLFVCCATPGFAQGQLPDGPGKAETVKVCGVCHEPVRAASVRLTRDGWQDLIAKMISLGAKGSDEDLEKVLDYLSANFKGDAPKPLNLNSATAVDLESVAAMLRKEAAAWIDYRSKKGGCKTLDDLKKVPGVDFKKIDERRDRLVCF
jgi:competence protein ComEA